MLWKDGSVYLDLVFFCYILLGLNLSKRLDVKFVKIDKLKTSVRSNKLISAEPIDQSGEVFEVRKRKSIIVDRIPVHCAQFILSSAKLHVLEFLRDMLNELDCSAFRIVYMGEYIAKRPRGVRAKLVPSANVLRRRQAAHRAG